MNRICLILAVVCVLGLAGAALGQDFGAAPACDCQGFGDPWNYSPQPSGLRFMPAGGGNGVPCCAPYNYCWAEGGCAICAHWTQYSWYASWGHGCLDKPRKHDWLH
ncbi:MAG: hypothetical protein AB7O59_22635 [Pirellulales bacterium]